MYRDGGDGEESAGRGATESREARPRREPRESRERREYTPFRQPAASRDPFFDQPYEATATASDAQAAWDSAAKASPARSGVSANIKPKKKIAALFRVAA